MLFFMIYSLILLVVVFLLPSIATAHPLLTISCDIPKGSSLEYGVSIPELAQIEGTSAPAPKPHLKGPKANGYTSRPTFVVDSNKKLLTITWSMSDTDVERMKYSKEHGMDFCCGPPPAGDASILLFNSNQISAIQVESLTGGNRVTLYSFFPKLESAFITWQGIDVWGIDPNNQNSDQSALFSTCKYSWNAP